MKNKVANIAIMLITISGILSLCSSKQKSEEKSNYGTGIEKVKPVIIKKIPHDPTAFTQGLQYNNGKLIESTGILGQSTIRIVDTTGKIEKYRMVPDVFAEGCALMHGLLYQITWQSGICITYKYPSLEIVNTISYKGEGWGLTSDNDKLYMSNGSDTISVRNAKFEILRNIPVKVSGKLLTSINELEFVNDKIYANVWFSDYIFVININNGSVEKIIDCTELVQIENSKNEQHVLNGIAYDENRGLFYITGKNWKNLFLVRIPE